MKVKANYGIGCEKGYFETGETFDIDAKDLPMYGDAVTVLDKAPEAKTEPAKEPEAKTEPAKEPEAKTEPAKEPETKAPEAGETEPAEEKQAAQKRTTRKRA